MDAYIEGLIFDAVTRPLYSKEIFTLQIPAIAFLDTCKRDPGGNHSLSSFRGDHGSTGRLCSIGMVKPFPLHDYLPSNESTEPVETGQIDVGYVDAVVDSWSTVHIDSTDRQKPKENEQLLEANRKQALAE